MTQRPLPAAAPGASAPVHHFAGEFGDVLRYSLTIACACGDRFAGEGPGYDEARGAALQALRVHLERADRR